MQIISSINVLSIALKNQANIGLVPTMGNLHAGHIHLVKLAKQHADCVVVSIFVNPLQFGANEDLANYPRTLEADCEKLKAAGCDIVFTPAVSEMYPQMTQSAADIQLNQSMTIEPPAIANDLCGASRPGHFAGVATVVAKLFNIVQPQTAFFGKKDFQQLFIIRELVKQLNYPIQIIAGETVREASGLALSSRNGYLSDAQKQQAAQLNQALQAIAKVIQPRNIEFDSLENAAKTKLNTDGWQVDYVTVRSALSLLPATQSDKHLVILAAAKIGNTRLIDNIELNLSM
ncbi:MAG: pantoate--beta-alanine ligase [Methylotenera sp.]|nr:pantoate--beta-alanine ligase [Methylotenera sp.]OQW69096.1 MAG: pantoate--beta-alanine ligase [Proteobacteria bacterium ST_bin12]